MFLSWIKQAAQRAAEQDYRAQTDVAREWTGEAWRDHRATFRAHLARVAEEQGERFNPR